jgi:hypothetical protein
MISRTDRLGLCDSDPNTPDFVDDTADGKSPNNSDNAPTLNDHGIPFRQIQASHLTPQDIRHQLTPVPMTMMRLTTQLKKQTMI